MVVEKMSLAVINANSPYEVKMALADDTLCFITDYDAEIFVTFERDDILHNGLVYQFGISNPKGVKSPRDPKVRETILAIVEEFFAKNNAALIIRKDNPQFADLVSEFMATVNLLNTKPEDYDE